MRGRMYPYRRRVIWPTVAIISRLTEAELEIREAEGEKMEGAQSKNVDINTGDVRAHSSYIHENDNDTTVRRQLEQLHAHEPQ